MVKAGGGLLVDDAELTPEWVPSNVLPVLADPHRLYEMSRAAAEFGRRDADDLLVGMVYEAIAAAPCTPLGRRTDGKGGGAWPDRRPPSAVHASRTSPGPPARSGGCGSRRLRTIIVLAAGRLVLLAAGAVWAAVRLAVAAGARSVTVTGTGVLTPAAGARGRRRAGRIAAGLRRHRRDRGATAPGIAPNRLG